MKPPGHMTIQKTRKKNGNLDHLQDKGVTLGLEEIPIYSKEPRIIILQGG